MEEMRGEAKAYYNLCRSCYPIQNNNYNHGPPYPYFLNNYDLHHTKPWEIQNNTCNHGQPYFLNNYDLHHTKPWEIQNNNYNHGQPYFLNNYDLHHTKPWEVNASGLVGRNPHKRAMMADLVTTARIYFNKSSSEVQKLAHDFFKSLDSNNDDKVSLQEFLGCMWQLGHVKMGSSHFFNELDQDMNGTLEFMEVMALYYIIKSGRPFCCGCDEFIPGMFFTCSVCFENGNNPFCVCPSCFQGEKFVHEHHQFLDSFAMLEAKRIQHKPNSSVTITVFEEPPTSTSNAVGPFNQTPPPRNWKYAWKALEMALNSAFSAAAGAAAGAGSCTIM